MSDCSTQAMEPKEVHCRNMKECVEMGVIVPDECFQYCHGDDSDAVRFERLAQVAWEMFHEYRELMKDYLWDNGASRSAIKQRRLIVMFHDRLEELGVSVDD